MSWYQAGKAAEEKKTAEEKKAAEERKNNVYRHWMPQEHSIKATFLDPNVYEDGVEMPFMFSEHNIQLKGHWRNWFTCIEGIPHPETGKPQRCPICASGDNPYTAAAFTIIDHSRWESKKKKGQFHQHERKLLVVKAEARKVILKRHAKKGELRGWLVEITRTGDKSVNTGNDFDFEHKHNSDQEFSEFTNGVHKALPAPVDYMKHFAPKTQEELSKIIRGQDTSPGYDDYDDSCETDDDNIAF